MLTADLNRLGRRIGAEFEMTVPRVGNGGGADIQRTLAEVLTANRLPAVSRGYSHDPLPPGTDFAVEFDSSVQGETQYAGISWFPIEIKTRVLSGYDDWERLVPKMLELVRYLGARVNPSCGHHVHLSFPEVQDDPTAIRSLFNLVKRVEPVVYGLIAPSRRTSGYCQPIPDEAKLLHRCRTVQCYKRALAHWNRRTGLNLTHLFDPAPRIEFRWHHGTLDAEKARHWLRFLLQLVEHAVTRNCQGTDEPLPADRRGVERLLVSLGLKVNSRIYSRVCPELRETGAFLLARWKHFNGKVALASVKAKAKVEVA